MKRSCSAEGCLNKHLARGLCSNHYQKLARDTKLEPITREERFWSKVNKTNTCWLWTASKYDSGYGAFGLGWRDVGYAHRVAYEWLVGPIPEGFVVDHICHVRHCVNPEHLRLATPKQNVENHSGPQKNNTSGYRGVSWHEGTGKWRGKVGHNYKYYDCGLHENLQDAAEAVRLKRIELHTHNNKDKD